MVGFMSHASHLGLALMHIQNTRHHAGRLSALLLALFCLFAASTASAGNGESLTGFIPDNAKAVLSVDVARLRTSGGLDALLRSTGAEAQLQRVVGQLDKVGFQPRQQIDTALIVVPNFDKNTQPLLIFEGDLPRAAIEDALNKEASATRSMTGTIPVYTRGARGSLAFLTDTIAVIGPTPQVQAAARLAGSARSSLNRTLDREIARVDKSRNLWFAGLPPAEHLKNTPLEGARALRGSANIAANLELTIDAVMPSADGATKSAEKSREQLTAMAARDEVAALGFAPVIQAANVTARGDAVRMTLNLDQARFRRLLNTVTTVIRDQLR